jgi:hypothetical protein
VTEARKALHLEHLGARIERLEQQARKEAAHS